MPTPEVNDQFRFNMEAIAGFAGFPPFRFVKEEPIIKCECDRETTELRYKVNGGCCDWCAKNADLTKEQS